MDKIIKLDIPQGYEYYGIEFEGGKILLRKKPIEFPKTYVDCQNIFPPTDRLRMARMLHKDYAIILEKFSQLLLCRDAYWKIAGEKMGLYKSWEPEYVPLEDNTYFTIQTFNGKIDKSATSHRNAILAFPTKEMRDAFYDNFKTLIESCKDLL